MDDKEIMSFRDEEGNKVDFEAVARIFLDNKEYLLLNDDYEFKIVKISNNLITFKSNKTGLTARNSLIEQVKTFTLKKGEELKLMTQTTDYSETLIIK